MALLSKLSASQDSAIAKLIADSDAQKLEAFLEPRIAGRCCPIIYAQHLPRRRSLFQQLHQTMESLVDGSGHAQLSTPADQKAIQRINLSGFSADNVLRG
jgi:hypothetical protein